MNMPMSSTNNIPADILPYTEGMRVVGARLINFAVKSPKLLESHKDWIRMHLVPALKKHPGCWVDLTGYASRTGSDSPNMTLGFQRAAEVKLFLRSHHPTLKFNLIDSKGEEGAKNFGEPDGTESNFWRAVLIRWHGVPLNIPIPVRPPEPKPKIKFKTYAAPKGRWLILKVDTFGIPIRAAITGGSAVVYLLNDKGELWKITGYGLGLGLGPDIPLDKYLTKLGPVAKWIVNLVTNIGTNAGDIGDIPGMPNPGITGPSATGGLVLRHLDVAANLSIYDIVAESNFNISSGEAHIMVAGVEAGIISFGFNPVVGKTPWGLYTMEGLGTMKGSLGVSAIRYRITCYKCITTHYKGEIDLSIDDKNVPCDNKKAA